MLAKNVNDNACFLSKRGACAFFASKLAPKKSASDCQVPAGASGTWGNAAPLGHSIQICPCCFIFPANSPAALPVPQNRSARTSPVIAPPVSCAATGRASGVPSGLVVDYQNRLPSGITLRSTATL